MVTVLRCALRRVTTCNWQIALYSITVLSVPFEGYPKGWRTFAMCVRRSRSLEKPPKYFTAHDLNFAGGLFTIERVPLGLI